MIHSPPLLMCWSRLLFSLGFYLALLSSIHSSTRLLAAACAVSAARLSVTPPFFQRAAVFLLLCCVVYYAGADDISTLTCFSFLLLSVCFLQLALPAPAPIFSIPCRCQHLSPALPAYLPEGACKLPWSPDCDVTPPPLPTRLVLNKVRCLPCALVTHRCFLTFSASHVTQHGRSR